jgi:sec-independent protein translocase protein TatB
LNSVGPSELFLLFIIGILILGPERLPKVASQIGRWVGRARRTANQLRYQLEREVALGEIEKKTAAKRQEATSGPAAAPTIAKPESVAAATAPPAPMPDPAASVTNQQTPPSAPPASDASGATAAPAVAPDDQPHQQAHH